MADRSEMASQGQYDSVPAPTDPSHLRQGYGGGSNAQLTDKDELHFSTAATGNPVQPSPLSQSDQRQGSQVGRNVSSVQNGNALSGASPATSSRGSTLKKKNSLKHSDSTRRNLAETIKSRVIDHEEKLVVGDEDNTNSAYYTPVPTTGTPTEVLANRFQAWRQVLKDLVVYYREIQASYENRSKSLSKVSNVINNTITPAVFMAEGEGGIAGATHILRDFHKKSILESNKAKEIEEDVIAQLSGLRGDLHQKVKEIKSLSGDFKNSVEKEMEGTRKAVHMLKEALHQLDTEPNAPSAKEDPFLVRLALERQLERQIEEENYLHRAYLNLEGSGRELESIVVGEIQKSYNALAGILRREADEGYDAIEHLRAGPLSMPKDYEWNTFVERDPRFVDPSVPLRKFENIEYPGKYHPGAAEVRSGMLERKSKYLKSYSPGWYVLSPTYLHEYKSPDRIHLQNPVMSLFLLEQRLGSHSQPGSSSHKFILKGRQAGGMHRGHSWVFRAESHETMLAWYQDIKSLTEKTGEERHAFVRKHARSISSQSQTAVSFDSDGGLEEDEADQTPYSARAQTVTEAPNQDTVVRPQPGGRFPSDLRLERGLRAARYSSSASSEPDRGVIGAPGISQGIQEPSAGQSTFPGREPESGVFVLASSGPAEEYRRIGGPLDQHPIIPASSGEGPEHTWGSGGIQRADQYQTASANEGPENTLESGPSERADQPPVVFAPAHSQYTTLHAQAEPSKDYLGQSQYTNTPQAAPTVQPDTEPGQPSLQSDPSQERFPEYPTQTERDVTPHDIAGPSAGLAGLAVFGGPREQPARNEPVTHQMNQVPGQEPPATQPVPSATDFLTGERSISPGKSEADTSEVPITVTKTTAPMAMESASRDVTLPTSDSPDRTSNNGEVVQQKVTVVETEVHTRQVIVVPSDSQEET